MDKLGAAPAADLGTRFTQRVIPIAFCLSMLGILAVATLAWHLLARAKDSQALVLHTTLAISRLEALQRTLVEGESAGRAFLITGERDFRDSFARTSALIDSELYAFKDFTSDDKTQQELAGHLAQVIGSRFAYLDGQIRRRASHGLAGLQDSTIGAGTAEMQRISAIIARMKDVENGRLTERIRVHQRHDSYLKSGLILVVVVGIALIAAVFRYMSVLWRERQAAEERALHLAQHDPLTGLPNRRLLSDRIQMRLAQAMRNRELLAVLCLDLDGFKLVNDAHGHDGGDQLLRLVAQRLQDTVRAVDTTARTGGDEFVLVLSDVKEQKYGEAVAAKIIERVSAPYPFAGAEVSIGTSVGIAFYPIHGSTEDELLRRADEALYEAKRLGKLRCEIARVGLESPAVPPRHQPSAAVP